jgi:hypothetical protein
VAEASQPELSVGDHVVALVRVRSVLLGEERHAQAEVEAEAAEGRSG